ncbi:MAG: hypothetical protein Q8P18_25460 [Pseudomonadota bacterium]|nr:hypothetical protein [Pseudomonadota bacterium]
MRTLSPVFPLVLLLACTGDKPALPDTGPDVVACEELDRVAMLEHVIDGTATDCELVGFEAFVEERKGDNGPWKQDIQMAFSEDASTFVALEGVVIETAAVPEVVATDDGRFWLYYVDGRYDHALELANERSTWMLTHGVPGLGALALAVSEDGRTFTPVDDFLVDGLVRGMVVDPDVVRQPDGTWRMYYVGMTPEEYLTSATWTYPETHEVYWAVSDDLVHWTQQGSAVRGPYADPSVYCSEGDRCVMASFGLEWGRSTDGGVSFTHDGALGVDGFAPEFVRFEDESMRIFYNSSAVGAPVHTLYLGEDDIWAADGGERMPDSYGEAVTLARAVPTGWYMWYHVFKDGSEPI